ncbi:MAG TPA: N-methyl-L-tryptophan oxidase [Acidimicrobiia bacterium]|nr:N-methyl-L-tryptophan oxidase [Acidimicrobiia bacterium]
MRRRRVIVLGLGGIGSAAAYWASRRLGDEVLGLEQFELGHGNGGSEDHSRIIRLSYHTPGYVELAKAAYEAWAGLEDDSGETVILRTGGLDLAPAEATIGLDDYRSSMTTAGVVFEELDASDVMRQWPQWRLDEDVTALYQEQSGIAMASRANAAHRRMAREHGAELVATNEVMSVVEGADGVIVETAEGTYEADHLLVAAGAWTNRVTGHLGVTFPLEVTQEQVVYLDPSDPDAFAPHRFPIWIWMDEPAFYGFPVFGEPAVKVAWDRCELVTTPETREFEPRADVTAALRDFVARHLPQADQGVHLAKTCLYTLTPDRDFILDRLPGSERVTVAVGAGHAFKFASVLGSILVDLALDGVTDQDISPFTADRAILQETNPARSYMV